MWQRVALTCKIRPSRAPRAMPKGAYSKAVRKRSSRCCRAFPAALAAVTSSTWVMKWDGNPARSRSNEVLTRAQRMLPLWPTYRFSNRQEEVLPERSFADTAREASRSSGWVTSDQLPERSSEGERPRRSQKARLTCKRRPSVEERHIPYGACSKAVRKRSSLERRSFSARSRSAISHFNCLLEDCNASARR